MLSLNYTYIAKKAIERREAFHMVTTQSLYSTYKCHTLVYLLSEIHMVF